jgi:hypothetical protein
MRDSIRKAIIRLRVQGLNFESRPCTFREVVHKVRRRDFLKHGLTAAAGGLMAAGLGDLIFEDVHGGGVSNTASPKSSPVPSSTSVSLSSAQGSTSGSTSGTLLADYQDFLDWLGSVSSAALSGLNKTLSISMESEFAPIALQARSGDFRGYSGVNDVYNLQPYSQQLSAVLLMASTKSPSYDIFSIDGQNIGVLQDALVSPTELAETYPELTYPGLDILDFSRFAWNDVATYPPIQPGGSSASSSSSSVSSSLSSGTTMFPLDMPLLVLFCRADVYSTLGMALPKTWDDYYEDVVAISKSGITPFGVVNMASGTISIVYEYAVHLASFGGQLWDVEGDTLVPTLNTDQAVAALENYVRFEPYSDPGSAAFNWDNVFDDLSRGIAATGMEWHDYYSWINDPSRSQVSGKIALSINPSGPSGSFSTFGGSGVGVSAFSRNQEAAWLWLQWATAKGTQETLLLDQYHVYPSRKSVLDVAAVSSEIAAGGAGEYGGVALAQQIWAASDGVTALVGFPAWLQVLDILAAQLAEAWMGKVSPSTALDGAQQEVDGLGHLTF